MCMHALMFLIGGIGESVAALLSSTTPEIAERMLT